MIVQSSKAVAFPDEYITDFCSMDQHGLVTVASSGSLHVLPLDPVKIDATTRLYTSINTQNSISGLKKVDENVLATVGPDGLKLRDLRVPASGITKLVSHIVPQTGAGALCLDIKGYNVAVGTELVNSDAAVFVYDIRTSKQTTAYLDSHNDDVTVVNFHPSDPACLLSGSVDGLVNIYNTTIQDEDDAVYQGINHGASIHCARFLNNSRIFALSHMETLSIYQLADPDENVVEPKPTEFGDLRERFGCEYVVDWSTDNGLSPSYLVCGSNNNLQQLKLIPFHDEKPGDISTYIYLEGAHGEELVRSVHITPSYVCTGGEDGVVKYWTPELNITTTSESQEKLECDKEMSELHDTQQKASSGNEKPGKSHKKHSDKHKNHHHSRHKHKHHKKVKDASKPY